MPKGVYHRTEETIENMRKRRTGMHFSKKWKENIRLSKLGSNNPNYKRPRNKNTRRKISLSNSHPKPYLRGKNNPNWRGGIYPLTKKLRHSNAYKMWRSDVFIKDNFTCQDCGKIGGILNAHHIKKFSILVEEALNYLPLYDPYDAVMKYTPLWNVDNGKTLCVKCHDKTKGKKET